MLKPPYMIYDIYIYDIYIYIICMYNCIMYIYIYNDTSYTHPTFISSPIQPTCSPMLPSPSWNRVDTFRCQTGRKATGNSTKQGPDQGPNHQMSALFSWDFKQSPNMVDFIIWFHEDFTGDAGNIFTGIYNT